MFKASREELEGGGRGGGNSPWAVLGARNLLEKKVSMYDVAIAQSGDKEGMKSD